MSPKVFAVLWHLLLLSNCIQSLNILAVVPYSGRSHFDVFLPLLAGISRKGHNLTVVSHHSDGPENGWRDVTLDGVVNKHIIHIGMIGDTTITKLTVPIMLADFATVSDEKALPSKRFQEFIKENNTYDVILMEYFNTNAFMGLVKKLKAPVIALSSCALMPWTNMWFANPDNPAYIPNNFFGFSDRLSFIERVENTIALFTHHWIYYFYIARPGNLRSKKYLEEDLFEPNDIMYETSLMLVNTHFSLQTPSPLSPNVIQIGGIHVVEPKPLPEDLEKWINGSEHGVIYFSLGSMIKGHTLPEEKRKAFLNAFARLPQRVVWKWENETMPDKPQNVLIKKWMPQSDILAHPNIKAFISHGGLLGTIEAVNYGVPVVVMPQFGDQHTNAKALEKNGGGVILELADVTEETVYNALTTVLDPNFKKQAEELSARFRDRPLPPLETAIYWVEYVARHKGAHHMKTAAVGMPFYKYYLLDVFAFLTAVLAIHLYLAFVPIRFVVRKIRGCKKDAQKTKEKKQ